MQFKNCKYKIVSDFKKIYSERGNLGIVRCNKCKLIYTNPRAKDAEENYFGDAVVFFNEARLIFNGKKKHHRDRNYEDELKKIKKLKPHGKLLDIGCNMGFFLRKARESGYDVQGVEPSSSLSKIAAEQFNLSVQNSFFEKSIFLPNSFDIITMIDVFEHVTNPTELLKNAHSVLKEDGILCIKVPNGNYNLLKLKLAKILGKETKHDIFNSYEHVAHYTPQTMKKILSENGFSMKECFTNTSARLGKSCWTLLPISITLYTGLEKNNCEKYILANWKNKKIIRNENPFCSRFNVYHWQKGGPQNSKSNYQKTSKSQKLNSQFLNCTLRFIVLDIVI